MGDDTVEVLANNSTQLKLKPVLQLKSKTLMVFFFMYFSCPQQFVDRTKKVNTFKDRCVFKPYFQG